MRTSLALLAVLPVIALSLGCTMTHYVTQAAHGQDDLERRAVDIDTLLVEHRVEGKTRRLLSEVSSIKHFAETHGLRATPNYTTYVRLGRPAVAWNVSACEPLSFRPKVWGFPIVGDFTALNWFAEKDARAFAADLASNGWDVEVRGLTAYSTAGWFTDPIVSSMLSRGDEALGHLADVVLHESTHATFFVPGQSALNESVASFTGDQLAMMYMDERVGREARETLAYAQSERTSTDRVRELHAAYEALDALYRGPATREEKLREKARILNAARERTHYPRPLTNATLIQYRTYNSGKEELAALLAACNQSFPRFFAALETIKTKPAREAQSFAVGAMVAPLVRAGCKAP